MRDELRIASTVSVHFFDQIQIKQTIFICLLLLYKIHQLVD